MRNTRPLTIALVFALAVLPAGCWNHDEAPVPKTILDNPIVNRLPNNTLAFLFWDTQGDAYRRFKESQWGAAARTDWLAAVERFSGEQNRRIGRSLFNVLKTAGLTSSPAGRSENVRQGLLFLGGTPDQPAFGIVLTANDGVNFIEKVSALESVFKTEGLKVSRQRVGQYEGLVAAVPEDWGPSPIIRSFYLVTDGLQLAVCNDAQLSASMLAEESRTQPGPAVQNALQMRRSVQGVTGEYAAGFIDFDMALKKLPSGITTLKDIPQVNQLSEGTLPFGSVLLIEEMSNAPGNTIAVSTSAHNDNQKRWLSALAASGGVTAVTSAPSSVAAQLSFDGKLLSQLKNAALSEMTGDEQKRLSPGLAFIDGLTSAGIGIVSANKDSPLGGLSLSFQSADAAGVSQSLKELARGLSSSAIMSFSDWNTMQIAGAQVDFIQSPVPGLGVYIGGLRGNAVIATSQDIFRDTLSALGKGQLAISSGLAKSSVEILNSKPAAAGYFDFARIAVLMDSARESVASLAQATSPLEPEAIERMKNLGALTVAVKLENDLLTVKSRYSKAAIP